MVAKPSRAHPFRTSHRSSHCWTGVYPRFHVPLRQGDDAAGNGRVEGHEDAEEEDDPEDGSLAALQSCNPVEVHRGRSRHNLTGDVVLGVSWPRSGAGSLQGQRLTLHKHIRDTHPPCARLSACTQAPVPSTCARVTAPGAEASSF